MTPAPRLRRVRTLGSTAVEFAVILPIAVGVTFGAIEVGRMVACRQMLTYATMEGVRVAASMGTTSSSTVQSAVIDAAPMLALTTSNVTVQAALGPPTTDCASWGTAVWGGITYANRKKSSRDCVRITVNYTFSPAFGVRWWTSHAWTEVQAMEVF